jgi:hypothetical protein
MGDKASYKKGTNINEGLSCGYCHRHHPTSVAGAGFLLAFLLTRTVLPRSITSPAIPAGGQFQFSFDTATGVNYAVQYSTNLAQWFPFVTVGGIGVPLNVIDPNAAGSQQRFYRVILSQP